MKRITAAEVPEFDGIVSFANWWNGNGGFILEPDPIEIYNVGVAVTTVIFRHKRFQVEQYLLCSSSGVVEHLHPAIDSVLSPRGRYFGKHITEAEVDWGAKMHGAALQTPAINDHGMFFYVSQHWKNPEEKMSSVLCSWQGAPPLNEAHAKLLAEYA